MRPVVATFLVLVTIASCVGTRYRPSERPSSRDFEFSILRDDEAKRFLLRLRSFASRDLCVHVEDWPNQSGQLSQSKHDIRVRSNSGVFLPALVNFGYCIGPCEIRIRPGEQISGFVNYKEFPDWISSGTTVTLELNPYVRYCQEHE